MDAFRWRTSTLRKKISLETDWETELIELYNVSEFPENGEASGSETPDPGFHLPLCSNEELNDVAELSNLSDQSDEFNHGISNPFILNEAEESPNKCTSSSDNATTAKISKQKKNC